MNRLEVVERDMTDPIYDRQDKEGREALQAALVRMSSLANDAGDAEQGGKFVELSAKLAEDCLTIAFCGHFSAGKSTLINKLCGAALLPSSPIPTSANVVTIRGGQPSASVCMRNRDGAVVEEREIDVGALQDFAVDGEGVASIEVRYPVPLLGEHMAIVDTPGVDSTDGAHRAATESALHLADAVIYVTDYNHVLADVNFRFLRTLAEWGKPTYVVVNQIDKHREAEVAFATFREGIETSLASWGIEPAGLLFLSLREPDHPLSEWESLVAVLERLKPLRGELMMRSAERSARYLAERFRESLHVFNREERERLLTQADVDEGAEALRELGAQRARLEAETERGRAAGDARREALRAELDRLLANANLTPAQTREKAAAVLESMQPGFKIGWFANAAKTEAERVRRLELLADDMGRQIVAGLDAHVRDLLRREAREAGWTGAAMEDSLAAAFVVEVTPDWLRSRVKPGTGADGQATLHYAADLGADVRAAYRRDALAWYAQVEELRAPEREQEAQRLAGELAELRLREAAAVAAADLEREERAEMERLLALLPERTAAAETLPLPGPERLAAATGDRADLVGQQADGGQQNNFARERVRPVQADVVAGDGSEIGGSSDSTGEANDATGSAREIGGVLNGGRSADALTRGGNETGRVNVASEADEPSGDRRQNDVAEAEFPLGAPGRVVERLEQAAELLGSIPSLTGVADSLRVRAKRFRERKFTIALFGAFSAGKSSFANAMVGRAALPVSPNPTTATINRIVAPTAELADGTARITMKTADAMLADIRHSLQRLGLPATEVEAAGDDAGALLAMALCLPAEEVHPRGKPHLAFLRAASAGWPMYGAKLGAAFAAGVAEYRKYAADEQASCFVAEIDLAVDSPLTRSGAVLVDTPGADSINARHTGVAFEYIKNADAVLFVTYYNHAFTEADRRFLNQLGSVKDVFELDKMFFLINAADLASSDQERDAVKEHVAAQLLKHGIRHPRLLAVSSLNGLQARSAGDRSGWEASGMAAFEAAFRTFAGTELGEMAAAKARKELERAGKQLEGWLHAASADAASREEEVRRRLAQAQAWRERAAGSVPEAVLQPIQQEIAEQLYHSRQRVYYRYGEHFQTAFHPSVLQDDGRDLKKLLVACWDDLKRSVGEDMQQEMRAAGLRLESVLQRQVEAQLAEAAAEWADEGFTTSSNAQAAIQWPMNEPFAAGPQMEARRLWQVFKSPRHFFENEGKKALQEQAEPLLFQALDAWLADLQAQWQLLVVEAYRRMLQEAYSRMANELAAFAQHLGESLQQPDLPDRIARLRSQWQWIQGS